MPRRCSVRIVGERLDAGPVDGVVAHDPDVGPRGLERLDEVEREAVVVVDDEDHDDALASRRIDVTATVAVVPASAAGASGTPAARSIARRSAAALWSVSSNSRSGTEPATMPGAGVDVGLAVRAPRCGS